MLHPLPVHEPLSLIWQSGLFMLSTRRHFRMLRLADALQATIEPGGLTVVWS
jgi:hypothetical protein